MAIQLSAMTKGKKSQEKNVSGRTKIMESFSACWVASVLGVVSAKISKITVTPTVEMRMPCSCQMEMASVVASAAAAVLARLVPRRTVERNFSGRSSILARCLPPFALVLIRCSSLMRCTEKKAVSELQKKAERTRHIRNSARYNNSVFNILYNAWLLLFRVLLFFALLFFVRLVRRASTASFSLVNRIFSILRPRISVITSFNPL